MEKRNLKKDKASEKIVSNPVLIKCKRRFVKIEFKKWQDINLN